MKTIVIGSIACLLMTGCSEKVQNAVKVLGDKTESKLVAVAGEAEVAVEFYRNQYASLKERLIRLKTLKYIFSEKLDESYASNDPRRIALYEIQIKSLNEKIPLAEKSLKEFFDIYQSQKMELKLMKDELVSYKAVGHLSDSLDVTSEYEKRATYIKELENSMKEKVNRAKSLLDVKNFEETYTNI